MLEYDDNLPPAYYDRLFDQVRPLPLLNRNDLDLLFDYLFEHSFNALRLKAEWDDASAKGELELFLASLARVVGKNGTPLCIVRTKDDGTKLLKCLKEGFVSTMFLDCDV